MLLAACGGDDPTTVEKLAAERRAQAEQVARDAKLDEDVQDFLGDAAEAVAATFTVVYERDGATTTLTQRPPDRRVDVAKGTTTESVFRVGGDVFACTQEQGGPWECGAAPASAGLDPDLGVFSPARLSSTAKALGQSRDDYGFAIASRRVAGADARCLVTTPKSGGQADELCIASTGAILRVRSGAVSLEATSYRPEVRARAFDLPTAPG